MTTERHLTAVDDPLTDEIDEELLPGGPEPEVPSEDDIAEAVATDNAAMAALDGVTAVPDGDAWVDPIREGERTEAPVAPKKPERKRVRRLPPANIGEAIIEIPVHLRLISMGKGVANVSTTLVFDFDYPIDGMKDVMGEHAYSAVFRNDYLGNGIILKESPTKVDNENKVEQTLKVTMPRFDNGADQIVSYIVPLLPEDVDLTSLLGMSLSWRLNIPVDFPGKLTVHRMQESFDLTGKGASDGANEKI